MKILHIVPSLSPSLGGPTEVVIHLVRTLRELGIDSEIATTNDDGDGVLPVPVDERVMYRGVPCRFFERSFIRKRQYIFSWPLTAWLWKNVINYDMLDIHYLFTYSSTIAATICRYHRVPYTLRTIGQLAPWSLSQSSLRKQLYTLIIEHKNLCSAGAIHCTTPGEADDVGRYGVTSRRVVIPLGVEIPEIPADSRRRLRRELGREEDVPLLLFLSRLHPKKRPELLIEALRSIRQAGSNAELVIAGTGTKEYEDALRRHADDCGVGQETHFIGFVDGDRKNLVLGGADLFVLPSYSENFGIAVAEALAARLPVVITPEIQIAPDVTAYKAGMVVEGTAPSFAVAILELLNNPPRRAELAQNGLKLVREVYSWELAAKQCATVYAEIIAAGPRHHLSSKDAITTL